MFNFDLNLIETLLKNAGMAHVGFAADFNEARKRAVQMPTLFVLPLDEQFEEVTSVTGLDEYLASEVIAVMIVIPCHTGNANSDKQIKTLRDQVKNTVAGCQFTGWEPIKLHRGRTVELNRETNNLIYQCQFKVNGNITVSTKVM